MSVKLIVHPGHYKCGSSTIQNFLSVNLDTLEEMGIGIVNQDLNIGKPVNKSWSKPDNYFERMIFENNKLGDFQERLLNLKQAADNSKYHTIILTEERLSDRRTLYGSLTLHSAIADVFENIKVIYYMRRQDDFILSAWQQWGHKEQKTLLEYTNILLENGMANFLQNIKKFKEFYGTNNIEVSLLNRITLIKGDLMTDFLSRIGIEDTPERFQKVDNSNKGINIQYCDILRRTPGWYQNVTDNSVRKMLETYCLNSRDILFDRKKSMEFYKICNEIMEYYLADNKELYKQYFKSYDFDILFGKTKNIEALIDQKKNEEIEELKDLLAIQNDLIFSLIKHHEEIQKRIKKLSQSFSFKIKNKLKTILKI